MLTSLLRTFLLFSIIAQLGCAISYYNDYAHKSFIQESRLISISNPEEDFDGKKIIKLVWEKPVALFSPVTSMPVSYDSYHQTWRAYPVEKIPPELLGKHLQKMVKIRYRVVMFTDPPLIYINVFQLLEK